MVKYALLGQVLMFDDAAERYFDLNFAANNASVAAKEHFVDWYKQCGNIETVLQGYEDVARELLSELAFQPLFSQLPNCGIYDISQETYWNSCIQFGEAAASAEAVEQKYLAIIGQQEKDRQAREYRKNSRGRWSGGGFGMSGAIKGAAEAAAMNAVTGLGHSAFNAIGNAGSALSASMEKNSLYHDDNTRNTLQKGIISDLYSAFSAHMSLLNKYHPQYIRSIFDYDKSNALFDNARKLPEKRSELLLQAVQFCPWNAALVRYIFINFPSDRETVCKIAERFSVDLISCMEDMLAQEYTDLAQSSESEAQKARERILQLMRKYRITESATLDQLETDCLQRLCSNCANASKSECDQLIIAINQYPAQEKLKPAFLKSVELRIDNIWTNELEQICQGYANADESTCERIAETVRCHEARDELKAPFLEKIQKRIEAIWSAEDGEIFDNLYLKTDVSDPKAIADATAYIQSKGRTASSQKYLDALGACNPQTIKRARTYKYGKLPKVYLILALLSLVPCFFGAAIVGIPLAAIFFFLRRRLKKAWNVLTIDGKVIHPVLLQATASGTTEMQEESAQGENELGRGQT